MTGSEGFFRLQKHYYILRVGTQKRTRVAVAAVGHVILISIMQNVACYYKPSGFQTFAITTSPTAVLS